MKRALVLTIACVIGLGIAGFAASPGMLSGVWTANICFDPQTTGNNITSFTSTLDIDYTVAGWTFSSASTFGITGWLEQEFSASGTLGAFSIGSTTVFDPGNATFTSWSVNAGLSLAGVAFSGTFMLGECQTPGGPYGAGAVVTASGAVNGFTLGVNAYFNTALDADDVLGIVDCDCCLCFTSIDFEGAIPWPCVEAVTYSFGFSCENGFEGITFCAVDLIFPNLSWVVFDVCVTFTTTQTEQKVLTISPTLNLGEVESCITFYMADITGVSFAGFEVIGVAVEACWNGICFTSTSAVLPLYSLADLGFDDYGDYWESFCIASEGDTCCGGGFTFDVCNYFAFDSNLLFDWALIEANLKFGITSNFFITSSLSVDDTGFDSWCFGFEVDW
jgi:hypothetical protein